MIKDNPNIWVFENPKTISIWWDHIPFEMKVSVLWRNSIFHVRVLAHKIENGSTRTLSFLHENRTYHCKLTKWKYTGGGHGDKYPEIYTLSHKIKIFSGLNFLSLTDELIIPDKEEVKIDEKPFNIFCLAEDIDFDLPCLK